MPRDEFERLERRWRERPLFLQEPPRSRLWILAVLILAAGIVLGLAASADPTTRQLIGQLMEAESEPPAPQSSQLTPTHLDLREGER